MTDGILANEQYIFSGTKKLRCGFTTGTCAALASRAAVESLLSARVPETVSLRTPKGWLARADVVADATSLVPIASGGTRFRCGVKKDAGDDPDVTDGCLVFATAELFPMDATPMATAGLDSAVVGSVPMATAQMTAAESAQMGFAQTALVGSVSLGSVPMATAETASVDTAEMDSAETAQMASAPMAAAESAQMGFAQTSPKASAPLTTAKSAPVAAAGLDSAAVGSVPMAAAPMAAAESAPVAAAPMGSVPDGDGAVRVVIDGGAGVGRVTKPGLDQPVGEAAINRVPRRMISDAVRDVCEAFGFAGEVRVTIDIPDGERLAEKTFNPQLGIEGGISVIGTSGVVEPMSEQALLDALETEIRVIAASYADKTDRPLVITPGNYGKDFVARYPELEKIPVLKCSNFIGAALDLAAAYGFTHVTLAGHAGKFVKLAGGIMNTHSRVADCRMELLCAHAALCGAEKTVLARIMDCATVDAALSVLDEAGLTEKTVRSLVYAAKMHVARRVDGAYSFGLVMFTNERGVIGSVQATGDA